MRFPKPTRRVAAIACGGLLAFLGILLSFGPLARSRIRELAARRGLAVQMGSVTPSGWGLRVHDVSLTSTHGTIVASIPQLRVGLSLALRPTSVEVLGAKVQLEGSIEHLRQELELGGGGGKGSAASQEAQLHASGLDVAWTLEGGTLQVSGASVDRDASRIRLGAERAEATSGRVHLVADQIAAELGSDRALRSVRARSATFGWAKATVTGLAPAPAPDIGAEAASRPPDASDLRKQLTKIAGRVTQFFPLDATADVENLTWQWGAEGAEGLTIGPGSAQARRTASHLELRFSSAEHEGRAGLSARALLPTDGVSDASVTLEGGPIALSLLGVQEGGMGLIDTARTTLGGKLSLSLAADGGSLTFDVEGTTRNLSIRQPRLASDPVRGLDAQVVARGLLDADGNLRFDELSTTLGVLHLEASGSLQRQGDQLAASFHFELPSTRCQSLLDSMPVALFPALQGTRWSGTFGARGRFAVDLQAPDALQLDYDVQDECRVTQVPVELSRARFTQPFRYRIYLPDGSVSEQLSGPGTSNWTALADISPFMQVAVLTTEDGAFPRHHGFNRAAIKSSIIANLKAGRFVRGASTLTMQLAKNLFLSREKTLSRKLEEVVLTEYLEQVFSKEELMELYLNVVEFGPSVYGITAASQYYFGRSPAELDLAESLFLSSLLPSPKRYGGMRDGEEAPESWMRGLRNLMRIAHRRELVTEAELDEGLTEHVVFWHGGIRPGPRSAVHRRSPLEGPADDVPDDTTDGP